MNRKRKSQATKEVTPRKRVFQPHWLNIFPWLQYDAENDLMFCRVCTSAGCTSGTSSFVSGNSRFRIGNVRAHGASSEHRIAEGFDEEKGRIDTFNEGIDMGEHGEETAQEDSDPLGLTVCAVKTEPEDIPDDDCNTASPAQLIDPARDLSQSLLPAYVTDASPGRHVKDEGSSGNDSEVKKWSFDIPSTDVPMPVPVEQIKSEEVGPEMGSETSSPENSASFGEEKFTTEEGNNYETTRYRSFQAHWFIAYPWLHYDTAERKMYCNLCLKHCYNSKRISNFIKGCSSFRVGGLRAHADSQEHRSAERAEAFLSQCCEESQTEPELELTPKETFLVKKYQGLFPWLSYQPTQGVLVCDLCQKHCQGRSHSMLMVPVKTLQAEPILFHRFTKVHVEAEELEAHSWSELWEVTQGQLEDASDSTCTSAGISAGSHGQLLDTTSVTVQNSGEQLNMSAGLAKCASESRIAMCLQSVTQTDGTYGQFDSIWLAEFDWLAYDDSNGAMYCKYCRDGEQRNIFSAGTKVFHKSLISLHCKKYSHEVAVKSCRTITST